MQVKVYLGEWMLNAGVIGFLRILQEAEDEFATLKKDYIEFDTEDLKNFSAYYFNYFFQNYNVANKTENRIKHNFGIIKLLLQKDMGTKEEEKQKKDRIKENKKYAKQTIKTQADKIKKINEQYYSEMMEESAKIDDINTEEDIEILEEVEVKISEILEKKEINQRLTMNFFKSILSKSYFGQPSFLNVVKTALTFDEQQALMQKDYVNNIIENGFLQDIVDNRYTTEEIKEKIKEKQEDILVTDSVKKIYANLDKKFLQKGKSLEDIKEYIQKNVFGYCSLCGREHCLTNQYSESNFVPLAISNDNMSNFFWNQNTKLPICDICKLMLFCTPAGVTSMTKVIKENGVYREKEIYSFINYDTSVTKLKNINENFAAKQTKDKNIENPYVDMIMDIVEQETELSTWQLENIFVVEFEAEYLAYSRMEYFNIRKPVALFFKNYAKQTLGNIKDYRFKLQIVDNLLKGKDIKYAVCEKLNENIKQGTAYGYNAFLATLVRATINKLKKEECKVNKEQIDKNNSNLYGLYNMGLHIRETLKAVNAENKIDAYAYKMLNSIKVGNKKEFMDIVIRLHMSLGKNVSPVFLEIMQEKNLDLESVGHSFLSGLISNRYDPDAQNKKEEVKGNE